MGTMVFAEPLTQFYGIDFGTDIDIALEMMQEKGWRYKLLKTVNHESKVTMVSGSAKYAGSSPTVLIMDFFDGKFYSAEIMYPVYSKNSNEVDVEQIYAIRDSFIEKYDCKVSGHPDKWTTEYTTVNGCVFSYCEKVHVRNRVSISIKVTDSAVTRSIRDELKDVIQMDI